MLVVAVMLQEFRCRARPGGGPVLIKEPVSGVSERFALLYNSLFS